MACDRIFLGLPGPDALLGFFFVLVLYPSTYVRPVEIEIEIFDGSRVRESQDRKMLISDI